METTLYNLLESLTGGTIVGLVTLSPVEMRKRNNPFIECNVTKRVKRQMQFGYSYKNAVNNRIEKAGGERNFIPKPRTWGEFVVANKIISHKGSFYGNFYLMPNEHITSEYFIDGRKATAEEIAEIRKFEVAHKHTASATQANAGLEENQVQPRPIKFENIVSIKVKGNEYTFGK